MKRPLRRLIFNLLLFVPMLCQAQSFWDWWDQLHNYPDAAGPNRRRYINISPGYMGPNAFAIPSLPNMTIDDELWLQVAGQMHRGNGDETDNLFVKANIPLAKNKVSLYVTSVAYETWHVTAETRDERRMISIHEGNSGDLAYGFVVKAFEEGKLLPFNFGFRAHVKTTTGGQLENARSTDHSLYLWDGIFSKTLVNKEDQKLLVKLAVGFLTWQTNMNKLPGGSNQLQNDAISYGLGIEYTRKKWYLATDLSGFDGYIGNRDDPSFLRSQLEFRPSKFAVRAEYNYGLKSWDWNTATLGVRYYFLEVKK
ncbi:hypothetical protein [Roseivirga pacifica]|uniref:hypothetical protein n=1 Tax=Roseivirga pacifica TaxID=1267423 RepID=UPI003BAFB4C2